MSYDYQFTNDDTTVKDCDGKNDSLLKKLACTQMGKKLHDCNEQTRLPLQ